MKKMTINEIAKEAGVSKTTVSRVLNHGELVDEKTRIKVEEIMRKHDYTPSRMARNLARQSNNTIGVIIPEIDNMFYSKLLRTIITIADEKGLVPICFDTNNNPKKDIKSLNILIEQQVGAVIYAPSVEYGDREDEEKIIEALDKLNVPTVLLDRKVPKFNKKGVYFENYEAVKTSTKLLIAAGHKNIAVIGGKQSIGIARERLDGYIDALNDEGIRVNKKHIFEGDFTAETSYKLGKQILEMKNRPTAVITFNNTSGLGFVQALSEKRKHQDIDIAHMGIDEIDAFDYLGLSYNHVVRSREEMAREAMSLLISMMKRDAKKATDRYIKPKFALDGTWSAIALENNLIDINDLYDQKEWRN
ncbi:MAG: LacI family DNA-binding transcriptional regulator [Suipraeoptans sp.]